MKISNQKLCKCGCGAEITVGHEYIKCHSSRIIKYKITSMPCSCGCRSMTKKGNKFVHGHNRQGAIHNEDTKKRIKETNIKTYSNPEVIEKFMGKNNPSFGTKHSNRELDIMREKANKRYRDPVFINKIAKAWNIKPNKLELYLLAILNNLYPDQWKYTGDFSFTINGKCPDFVNCNGQKKIIEMFGDYWHRGQNPQDRIDAFTPFGYETLVIWESELKNMDSVKGRIERFCEHEN